MDGNDCVIQVFNFISKRQHTALQISSNYIAFGDVTNTNIMLMWCQKWSVSYIPLMFFTKAATLPSKTTERTFSIYPSFSDEPIVDCVYCAKIDWARVKMMNIPHVDIIPKNIILHHNEFKDRKKMNDRYEHFLSLTLFFPVALPRNCVLHWICTDRPWRHSKFTSVIIINIHHMNTLPSDGLTDVSR